MPWRANFYPASIDAPDYLEFYSTRFDCVEVNLGNSLFKQQNRKDSRTGFGRHIEDDTVGFGCRKGKSHSYYC